VGDHLGIPPVVCFCLFATRFIHDHSPVLHLEGACQSQIILTRKTQHSCPPKSVHAQHLRPKTTRRCTDLGLCRRAHWLNTYRHSINFAVLRAAISYLVHAFDNSWASFVICRRIKRLALRTQVSHVNESEDAGHDQHHYPDRNARLPAVLVYRSCQSAKTESNVSTQAPTVRRLCRRPHEDLTPGGDGVVACDCHANDEGASFGILRDAWEFVSASSLRVPEIIQATVQDLQLRQPGKYQWRGAQTDVADEVARIRRRNRCRRWLGRPNGHCNARHEADKHWDSIISITLSATWRDNRM
jgi:hypothetical protein